MNAEKEESICLLFLLLIAKDEQWEAGIWKAFVK